MSDKRCVNCREIKDWRDRPQYGDYCFDCWNLGVKDKDERIAKLEAALRTIQQRNLLNPPNPEQHRDHSWLSRVVDDALAE